MFLSSFFLVETNEEPCAQLQLHEMDQKSDKKKLKQLLLTGNKLKIMWLDHCKKWNLETHMTFVDVDLIEETTEYRFVLLKNYMGNNPSKFFLGRPQKNLEGFAWSFLSITGLRSQRQFAPKCSFLASRPLGHCYFRISWQIP